MRIRLLVVLLTLVVVGAVALHTGMTYRFRYIVIHHSASTVDNYASIRSFHMSKHRWGDAAYHLILSNGSTDVPVGYLEATSRYEGLLPSIATPDPRSKSAWESTSVLSGTSARSRPIHNWPPLWATQSWNSSAGIRSLMTMSSFIDM